MRNWVLLAKRYIGMWPEMVHCVSMDKNSWSERKQRGKDCATKNLLTLSFEAHNADKNHYRR